MTALPWQRRARKLRTAVAHVDPDLPTIDQTLEVFKAQKFWARGLPRWRLERWLRKLESRECLTRWETAQKGAIKWTLARGDNPFPSEDPR